MILSNIDVYVQVKFFCITVNGDLRWWFDGDHQEEAVAGATVNPSGNITCHCGVHGDVFALGTSSGIITLYNVVTMRPTMHLGQELLSCSKGRVVHCPSPASAEPPLRSNPQGLHSPCANSRDDRELLVLHVGPHCCAGSPPPSLQHQQHASTPTRTHTLVSHWVSRPVDQHMPNHCVGADRAMEGWCTTVNRVLYC